ncbi:MAG TPA: AP2 domain-containing protein, partial [Phycisphaerae bacterium]|nr:AP2 domain-containing protein [Phycisphaerae bacterium]
RSKNMANTKKKSTNTSTLKGAFWHKRAQKWMAQIMVDRKSIYLGLYQTPEEAHEAYAIAAKKYFGDFSRAA